MKIIVVIKISHLFLYTQLSNDIHHLQQKRRNKYIFSIFFFFLKQFLNSFRIINEKCPRRQFVKLLNIREGKNLKQPSNINNDVILRKKKGKMFKML